jgi:hypothetical protein
LKPLSQYQYYVHLSLQPNSQVFRWQHSQARSEKDYFAREDTQLALTTLLGTCATWEADDTDDVSTLDVLMLLLKRYVGLGFLQLAHDLNLGALSLACRLLAVEGIVVCRIRTNIEVQRVGGGALCHDAETNANLLVGLGLSLLEVRVVANIVGELVVGVELVRVRVRLLGGTKCVNLVGSDFEVLL